MTGNLRRRDVLVGALGAVSASHCSRQARSREKPAVSIVRANGYTQDVYDTVKRLLREHKVEARGKVVLLKPNLVEFSTERPINTHPIIVHAALEAFRELGASEVRIGEGPGHRRCTLDLAEAAGYFSTIPNFESLFVDLNLDDVSEVDLPARQSRLKSLHLSQTALGCDLLVSLPKMKTHHWVGATLSMKNLFGLVPGGVYGWPKNVLHWAGIDDSIVDVNSVFSNVFSIVDAIEGMEGNGPIQGQGKFVGAMVGGSDFVAVDATCCRIMRIDPGRVQYLKLAENRGETNASNVLQIGEPINSLQCTFDLLPDFSHLRLEESESG